jgi:hypothetical protein
MDYILANEQKTAKFRSKIQVSYARPGVFLQECLLGIPITQNLTLINETFCRSCFSHVFHSHCIETMYYAFETNIAISHLLRKYQGTSLFFSCRAKSHSVSGRSYNWPFRHWLALMRGFQSSCKCWDCSQIPNCFCILLMYPSRFKFIKVKNLLWRSPNLFSKFAILCN